MGRFQQSGNTQDRSRSGRPRVTSRQQDTHIRLEHLRNRFQTASWTAPGIPGLRPISPRTVRNLLRKQNIRPRRPAVRPVLLQPHRIARLAWCTRHLLLRIQDWANILFTDESRFHLNSSDGRCRVYRRVGERYQDACVVQRRQFGGGSVMVYGGISARGRTPLQIVNGNLTGVRYRDKIIQRHVIPFIQKHKNHIILQQDNARLRVARVVRDLFVQQNVDVMPWPAVYPDLTPIEHVWVNVALNKPAYQQYQYQPGDDRYDANNVVDGRKSDLSRDGGQCAVSYGKQTATWWVNMTTIHSIHHITIYFRTNNKPLGPSNYLTKYVLGFSVYVSNTTDKLQGTLCYKDDNFTLDTIPAVFTTACPVHGQYVIFYNERRPGTIYPGDYSKYVFSDLCEVEVYGCPTSGYFGFNCSVPCPDVNCQYCHIETGTCHGCKTGYRSYRCELACDKGSYGSQCKEICGHCRDTDQCSNINGTCLTGCDAGYQGDLCKICKCLVLLYIC
ncbi:uncharacterized protein [Magallana gigas]|uniref:uncharacterized protein n=1 Tax=Magallana gigas TaxID=29159 RepID=UPI00334231A9